MKLMPLCSTCHEDVLKAEVEGWRTKSMQLLTAGELEDIQASIACLLMQLFANKFLGNTAIGAVNKFAKQLIQEDLPELAIPLLFTICQQNEAPTEKLRAHVLASKALESLAYSPDTLYSEQLPLLKAAVEECDAASKVKATGTEIPDLTSRIASLEKTINVIESQDKRQLNNAKQLAYSKLKDAWSKGNWDFIFQLIADTASDHLKRADGTNPTMEAIKEFVKVNNDDSSQERFVLTFLQGIIDVFSEKISEGLNNVEIAVWGSDGKLSNKFYSTAIDIAIGALLQNSEHVIPLQKLYSCCEMVTKGGCLDPCSILPSLHLKEEDLLPPFKLHWSPSHQLSSQITSFEDFAVQKVTNGEWTCIQVAESYLDLIDSTEKCNDSTEIVLCFINAALWLLKMLIQKSAEPSASLGSEIFSLKMAVFHYIRQAFIITASCLHTGMQFYVARIAVAATVVASKYASSQATPNDAAQITQFLYTFIHTARFCPFWKAPLVSVSEAIILNKMIDRQHCIFLSKLEHIPEEFCHLEQFEVAYKLYENDFNDLQKLENPEEMKHRTMQELLRNKGLTWENVSSVMKSSLCKRTPEGWICSQQPVGTNLEFAEIKGLRVHLNNGVYSLLGPQITVELLVIRSNGNNGLISQSDMDTFLTIDAKELMPLYFSLDPPSRDEKFHPFQELRFHPKALENTEVLETLLDADYLMKFFSVGSEVSANPPFDQRPCSDGLLSKLPPYLREALKSVHQYGNAKSSLSRFWIEAKEMKYDIEQSGNVITVKCGSPEMIIRKHRMYHDPSGQMRDTDDDDDLDSAESQFAAAMTKHYDEIGQYFPAYARLKELCKLQLLTRFVKNNVAEISSTAKMEITDIEKNAKINVTAKTAIKSNLPCWWVPASVSRRITGFCYGGVNLAPHYVKSPLPTLPPNTVPVVLPKASSRIKKSESEDSDSSSASGWGSLAPQHHSATPKVRQSKDSRSSTRPQRYAHGAPSTDRWQKQPSSFQSPQQSSVPIYQLSKSDSRGSNTPRSYSSTPRGSQTRSSQSASTRRHTQKQPSNTSVPTYQRGSSNATRQSSASNSHSSLPSDTFRATKSASTKPSAKPVAQPPVVITTPTGCQELPIAKALLSSPTGHTSSIPHVFSTLPQAICQLLHSMCNGHHARGDRGRMNGSCALSNGVGIGVSCSGSGGGGGGAGSGGGEGGGDSGSGSNGHALPGTILTGVTMSLAFAITFIMKTSDIRDPHAQRKL